MIKYIYLPRNIVLVYDKAMNGRWEITNQKGSVFIIRLGVLRSIHPRGKCITLICGKFRLTIIKSTDPTLMESNDNG